MVKIGVGVRRKERRVLAFRVPIHGRRFEDVFLVRDLPDVVQMVKDVKPINPEFRGVSGSQTGQVIIADLKIILRLMRLDSPTLNIRQLIFP